MNIYLPGNVSLENKTHLLGLLFLSYGGILHIVLYCTLCCLLSISYPVMLQQSNFHVRIITVLSYLIIYWTFETYIYGLNYNMD